MRVPHSQTEGPQECSPRRPEVETPSLTGRGGVLLGPHQVALMIEVVVFGDDLRAVLDPVLDRLDLPGRFQIRLPLHILPTHNLGEIR